MTDDELEQQPNLPVSPRKLTPGKPPRMAKPMSARPVSGGLTEVPAEPPPKPVLDLTPDEPYDDVPAAMPEPEPTPDAIVPTPETIETIASDPAPAAPEPDLPKTVRETLRRVDEAWRAFHAAAARFPSERMDERLGEDGWTRKQMLAHVAAWHDLTADRLVKFLNAGTPPEFDQDTDQFNAMVARRAIGKTAGEILNDTEATFNRLRRQMQRLTDAQLQAGGWWAAWVIHGNTYGHYEEHWADVDMPEPSTGSSRR